MKTIEIIKKIEKGIYVVRLNGERWEVNYTWLSRGLNSHTPIVIGEVKFTPHEICLSINKAENDWLQPVCLDEVPVDELETARAKIDELETELGHLKMRENHETKEKESSRIRAFFTGMRDILNRSDQSVFILPHDLEFSYPKPDSLLAGSAGLNPGVNVEPPLKNPSGPVVFENRDFQVRELPPLNVLPSSHVQNNPLGGLVPVVGSKWNSLDNVTYSVVTTGNEVVLERISGSHSARWTGPVDSLFKNWTPVIEPQFRMLEVGEVIKEGDETNHPDGEWVKLTNLFNCRVIRNNTFRRPLK